MRRIDVISIGLGTFTAGGLVYLLLRQLGLGSQAAGIWTQAALMVGLVGWLFTYVFRALTQRMTYNQQLKDYAAAVLQKRLELLTPEELAQIRAEIELEQQNRSPKVLD